MSCDNCNCLDCSRQRSIDRAMNRSNDMDDDGPYPLPPREVWGEAAKAPIHRMSWREVEPANEVQAKAWGTIADHFIDHIVSMPLLRLVEAVCNSIMGLKPENRPMVFAQVERFIRESNRYEIRKGRTGGVFKREQTGGSDRSVVAPSYIALTPATNVPDLITGKLPDNCTCKGCGTGLNSSERSCWKCGAVQ